MKMIKIRMKHIVYTIASFLLCITLADTAGLVSVSAEADNSNFTNLIVFARFADEDEFINDIYDGNSVRKITDNSYNTADYCVSDYYRSVSENKLRMNSVYIYDNGGSIKLPHERGYYAAYSADNPIGYKTSGEKAVRMYELRQDWSNAVNNAVSNGNAITDVDGNRQYSYSDLDKNGDGIIDAITVIYKNTTQNISVYRNDPLWNYKDYSDYVEINVGGKIIKSKYYVQLTNSYDTLYQSSDNEPIVSLKTPIHEMGHIFELKDLYYNVGVSPIYYMSAMSNAISPVPQGITIKEKEALGWVDEKSLKTIEADGQYTLKAAGISESESDIAGYKIAIPGIEKVLYLEYRNFGNGGNKYDSQTKKLTRTDGANVSGMNLDLKSGLVCYLANEGMRFPSNTYKGEDGWNYEALGGTQATKSDAALGAGDTIQVKDKIKIKVISIDDNELTFSIEGGEYQSHIHSGGEADCIHKAVCDICGNEYGEINAQNHIHTIRRGQKDPTFDEYGYTGDVYCSDCGQVLEYGVALEKLVKPVILDGDKTVINISNSSLSGNKTVSFRSSAPLSEFQRVECDGNVITKDKDYTLKEGSTIVTLTPSYIVSLSEGNHSISIVSQNGTATAEFTVVKSGGSNNNNNNNSNNNGGNNNNNNSNNNGDNNNNNNNNNDDRIPEENTGNISGSGMAGGTSGNISETAAVSFAGQVNNSESPKTGDNNGILLMGIIMLMLMTILIGYVNWRES